jgi:ATP-dependent protease HslVU (ClpYQ) peptidase subunit
MTTIAYDGKSVCTDSQITSRNSVFGFSRKVFRLESGAIVAFCGKMVLAYAVMLWLDGKAERPAVVDAEGFTALLVEPDGSAWEYDESLSRCPACVPWAGGSGELIVATAMRCGKTAREAVAIACELDVYTGGEIQEMRHGH